MPPPTSPTSRTNEDGACAPGRVQDGRLDWVGEEMAELADPTTSFRADPETMGAAAAAQHSCRFLGMVRALAAWREREAQRVNIPRQRLLRDETLLQVLPRPHRAIRSS